MAQMKHRQILWIMTLRIIPKEEVGILPAFPRIQQECCENHFGLNEWYGLGLKP